MENKHKKCSLKNHSNKDAKIVCVNCNLSLCAKCEVFHSYFCKEHRTYNLDTDYRENFNGYCNENGHSIKLEYFCRTHNILCCAKCIAKIKNEKNGKHTDCNICNIEEIIDEKKGKFNENIKTLKELSETVKLSIENLKNIFDCIVKNKEKIKLEIQNSFDVINEVLNNRENQLMLEVDNIYDDIFIKEDIFKEIEKLPENIKLALESNYVANENNNEENIISLVNNCINIENYIKDINIMNEKIKTLKNVDNLTIDYIYNNEMILEQINKFGCFQRDIIPQFLKSSILKGDSKNQNLLTNWIKQKVKKDEINFELIFKMSENGSDSKNFHEFCDNKGPTLTLISTTEGKKFGGFTPLNWKNVGGFINDKSMSTFIFSLNLNKKFDIINKENNAIKVDENNGPNFGNGDIIVYQDMKEGKTYANEKTTFLRDNNLALIEKEGEQGTFNVDEIEVYKVIF